MLIQNYLQQFYKEFELLLKDHRDEDIGRMYSLVSRLPDGLVQMKEIFEVHVLNQGWLALEKNKDAATNVGTYVVLDIRISTPLSPSLLLSPHPSHHSSHPSHHSSPLSLLGSKGVCRCSFKCSQTVSQFSDRQL